MISEWHDSIFTHISSPTAYLNNPASERAQYSANADQLMVLLKLLGQGMRWVIVLKYVR